MANSISPGGEKFRLPGEEEYKEEYERLARITEEQKKQGREIVVVMGLGFVGAVMAGVIADCQAIGRRHSLNDGCQMLKPVAQIGPLAGGRLQGNLDMRIQETIMDDIKRLGDARNAGRLARTHV